LLLISHIINTFTPGEFLGLASKFGKIGQVMIQTSNNNPTAVAALTGFTLTAVGNLGSQQLLIGTEDKEVKRNLEKACWSAIASPLMLNW